MNEAAGSSYCGQEAFFVLHHPGHALLVLQSLLPFDLHVTDLIKKKKEDCNCRSSSGCITFLLISVPFF